MAKKRARVTEEATPIRDTILDQILQVDQQSMPLQMIAIEQIQPNPYQTRRYFDPERLEELATSMRANGFLGSLVARYADDVYQLAYGERRLRAAKIAGLAQLPLIVSPFSETQMMEVSVTENVNREDLLPLEEAEGYKMLHDAGYNYRTIAERVGKSLGHITAMMALLRYDDVRDAVSQARIRPYDAYEIAKIEQSEIRGQLIDKIAGSQLDRSSLKETIRQVTLVHDERQKDDATFTDEELGLPPIEPLTVYDPAPSLKVAIRQLRSIRADLFNDIPLYRHKDILTQLEEIASRTQQYIDSLEEHMPDDEIE